MDVIYNKFQNIRNICRSVQLLLPCTYVKQATEFAYSVNCKLPSYSNNRKVISLPSYCVMHFFSKVYFPKLLFMTKSLVIGKIIITTKFSIEQLRKFNKTGTHNCWDFSRYIYIYIYIYTYNTCTCCWYK